MDRVAKRRSRPMMTARFHFVLIMRLVILLRWMLVWYVAVHPFEWNMID